MVSRADPRAFLRSLHAGKDVDVLTQEGWHLGRVKEVRPGRSGPHYYVEVSTPSADEPVRRFKFHNDEIDATATEYIVPAGV